MKRTALGKQERDPDSHRVSGIDRINQLTRSEQTTSSEKGATGLDVEDEEAFKRKYRDLKRNAHGYQDFLSNHPVCETCRLDNQQCIVHSRLTCTYCRKKRKGCPRQTAFYVHELANSHKISEKDALRTLVSFGLIKAASTLQTADREYIVVDSDEEDDAMSDDGIKQVRESMEKTTIKMEGLRQDALESQVKNLKSEVKRLEGLLRTVRERGLADERLVDELRGEKAAYQSKIQDLTKSLEEERLLNRRLSDQFQNGGRSDGQQLITFLAQIGLYSSALRAQERTIRENQGADTNALAALLTSLQSVLDNAVANEQSRSLDISIPLSTTGSNSARRKRGQDNEDVQAERLIMNAPTSRRSNVQGNDKGEGPSNPKRFRH